MDPLPRHVGMAWLQEAYADCFRETSKFLHELLSAFGYAPVCNACPGQDSRAGYVAHVCGTNHFKFLWNNLNNVSKETARLNGQTTERYWQSWAFVLGEVRMGFHDWVLQHVIVHLRTIVSIILSYIIWFILHHITSHYITLHYIILYHIILYYMILYYTILYYIILCYYIILYKEHFWTCRNDRTMSIVHRLFTTCWG
jgi:hypothetical protein